MCGCNKKGSTRTGKRPAIGPKPTTRGIAAGTRSPNQIQALAREELKNVGGLGKQRRQVEQQRRALIARRKFSK